MTKKEKQVCEQMARDGLVYAENARNIAKSMSVMKKKVIL